MKSTTSNFASFTRRPSANICHKTVMHEEPDSTSLFKLILLSKRESIKGESRRGSKAFPQNRKKNRRLSRLRLDPIPEYPMMPDEEICYADPPGPLPAKNTTLTTKKTGPKHRRSGQFQMQWFNELENDMVRYALRLLKTILNDSPSVMITIVFLGACSTLLLSSAISVLHASFTTDRNRLIAHAIMATGKFMVFLAFLIVIAYGRFKKKCTVTPVIFVFASVCTQYATMVPSLYFTGCTRRCLLADPLENTVIEKASASMRDQSPVWHTVMEITTLLIGTLLADLYFALLIRHLFKSCYMLRQKCSTFLILCLSALIILEISAVTTMFSWLVNVSCSNHIPTPTYFTDLLYVKRRGYYGSRNTPGALVVFGGMIGLIMPSGIICFVAIHMEHFLSICAAILVTRDRSWSPIPVVTDVTIPDHIIRAAHTYLSWFYERPTIWQYCSLWIAARTMRRRDRIRQVATRFFLSWIWYICAVIAPSVVAIQCSFTWREWVETGGYSMSFFAIPLAMSSIFTVISNPLAFFIAPVTMILFTCWFITLIAVQIFYFFTLVLSPNSNF